MLWFAFKFVFLYWLIQLFRIIKNNLYSCDLLSNLYFCIGWYSAIYAVHLFFVVVICFQICIFVLVDTALSKETKLLLALWFAFKFVFLYWLIQLQGWKRKLEQSCDLLSNLYFCIGWYSALLCAVSWRIVVICFQICIFVLVDTAHKCLFTLK